MGLESIGELWEKVCQYCLEKELIAEVGLKLWIEELEPELGDDGRLYLITNNSLKKKTVDIYYKNKLQDALQTVSGLPMTIEVTVRNEEIIDNGQPKPVIGVTDSDFTFENFVVGSCNEYAHAVALAVSKNPGHRTNNPLFIYGNSGVGKTHLMLAIKNRIVRDFPDKKIICLRGEQFTNELISAIRNKTTEEFHEKFRDADVFCIDDIHFIAGKELAQEEFFNTFNSIYPKSQIIVTSDRPPKEIKTLEERIRSRFEGGILADMTPPDFETRVCIIKYKAELLGLNISDDICYYIAEQIRSNIRQLEGIVKKLYAYNNIHQGNITVSLIQSFIRDVIVETVNNPVTVEKVIDEVARSFNVTNEEIMSKNRSSDIVIARQTAMYVVNKIMNIPSTEIGRSFNKDHSTVLYSLREVEKRVKNDDSQKRLVDDIIKNLEQ